MCLKTNISFKTILIAKTSFYKFLPAILKMLKKKTTNLFDFLQQK